MILRASRFLSSLTPLWKQNVTVFPQTTCVDDLRNTFKPSKFGGFYIDHRLIVRDYPTSYTVSQLDTRRTGGIDEETGRRKYKRIGGGLKKYWYWVDLKRFGPSDVEKPLVEKVIRIVESDCHSAHLALVGHADQLRLIIATVGMEPGQLIRTYGAIPDTVVKVKEGDAWPIGAVLPNTEVCCIEPYPGYGARFCINAGTFGTIQSHSKDRTIIRLNPLKARPKEISVMKTCMVVIGQVGNVDHHKEQLGSANALRRSGYRPGSGWKHRKTGYSGRKLKRMKPALELCEEMYNEEELKFVRFTFDDFELRK